MNQKPDRRSEIGQFSHLQNLVLGEIKVEQGKLIALG
jgi:hypothetical protein